MPDKTRTVADVLAEVRALREAACKRARDLARYHAGKKARSAA